jgi:hypothetical protein
MDSLLYKHISETQVLALAEEFEPEKCKQVSLPRKNLNSWRLGGLEREGVGGVGDGVGGVGGG